MSAWPKFSTLLLMGVSLMAAEYTQMFADAAHSGYVDGACSAKDSIAWKQSIPYADKHGTRIVLCSGSRILTGGFDQYFVFTPEGAVVSKADTYPLSPLALRGDAVSFIPRGTTARLAVSSLDGKAVVENAEFPYSSALPGLYLFVPIENGLIAQLIDREPGNEIMQVLYLMHYKQLGWFDWFYTSKHPDVPVSTVVCDKASRLVTTTTTTEALVFKTDVKQGGDAIVEPLGRFATPLGQNAAWLSADPDCNLYWAGTQDSSILLTVTDAEGKQVRTLHPITCALPREAELLAPPIVTPGRVFLLARRALHAVENESVAWSFGTPDFDFRYATALNDNSVLVTKGSHVIRVAHDGSAAFDVDVEETIVAPPVVDDAGTVYVASEETLFAVK